VATLAPNLESQVGLDGITFLDRELLEHGVPGVVRAPSHGFEAALGQALKRRVAYLQSRGLLEAEGDEPRIKTSLLDDLYQRELDAIRPGLTARFGDFKALDDGMSFRGKIQSIEALPSGPHAVIAEAGRYTVIPASASLQQSLGRSVRLKLGAPKSLPALEPRALGLSIEVEYLARQRGIGFPR